MATREKEQTCADLIQKITSGARLNDDDKAHLAACEGCMIRAVRTLDEAALRDGLTPGTASGTNGHPSQDRTEAKRALEQGRRVFEREFGIKLSER